jgi:EAL domain-containing protein (putative c-di-GMP-specific phosphodiesterase class I)
VAPDEFVSVAEQAGFIRLLTQWVVQRAFSDLKDLRAKFPKLRLAINICADDLMDEQFQGMVSDALSEHQLNAADIILELTERVIVKNPDTVISKLLLLRTEGFKIAIDDFGTGYSSLAYLTELPIDTLKIDRCFVKDLTHNLKQQAVCKTILSLAQNFDMDVVAEGVEDGQSLAVLKSYGCQWAQGYFISQGLAKAELGEWLQQSGLCTIRKTFSK